MFRRTSLSAALLVLGLACARAQPSTTHPSNAVDSEAPYPVPGNILAGAIDDVGLHMALAQRSGDGKLVVSFDGRPGKEYDSIGRMSPQISPDGKHLTYFAKKEEKWLVVLDGIEGAEFDALGVETGGHGSPKFSPDSKHIAYQAKRGQSWVAVLDGHEGPSFEHIGLDMDSVLFSPDSKHLAYGAQRGKSWIVMLDGKEGREYSDIAQRSLQFSPDSKHLTYEAAPDGGEMRVVMDGQEERPYPGVGWPLVFSPDGKRYAYAANTTVYKPGKHSVSHYVAVVDGQERDGYNYVDERSLVFSPDSKHIAYVAGKDRKAFVVIDAKEEPPCDGAWSLRFSANSQRFAYGAAIGSKWVAVVDGQPGKQYDQFGKNSLVFSPDSKRVAFFAGKGKQWVVVVDGQEGNEYHEIGLGLGGSGSPFFSADSKRVAYEATRGELSSVWVVDGNELDDSNIAGTVTFSPDSKHIVYILRHAPNESVVVDGHSGLIYDHIWIGPVFNTDGALEYLAWKAGMVVRVKQPIPGAVQLGHH